MPEMPNDPDRAERLHRIGVTEDDFHALEQMWNTRVFGLTADQRTLLLAGQGHTALDTLDAIWHELLETPRTCACSTAKPRIRRSSSTPAPQPETTSGAPTSTSNASKPSSTTPRSRATSSSRSCSSPTAPQKQTR